MLVEVLPGCLMTIYREAVDALLPLAKVEDELLWPFEREANMLLGGNCLAALLGNVEV